jgi:hypothetical protein
MADRFTPRVLSAATQLLRMLIDATLANGTHNRVLH